MARGDFPRNIVGFQERFPDEGACLDYLPARAGPEDFRCPACEGRRARVLERRHPWECAGESTDLDHRGSRHARHPRAAASVVLGRLPGGDPHTRDLRLARRRSGCSSTTFRLLSACSGLMCVCRRRAEEPDIPAQPDHRLDSQRACRASWPSGPLAARACCSSRAVHPPRRRARRPKNTPRNRQAETEVRRLRASACANTASTPKPSRTPAGRSRPQGRPPARAGGGPASDGSGRKGLRALPTSSPKSSGEPLPRSRRPNTKKLCRRFAKCMREHGIEVEAIASRVASVIAGQRPGGGGPNPESPGFKAGAGRLPEAGAGRGPVRSTASPAATARRRSWA